MCSTQRVMLERETHQIGACGAVLRPLDACPLSAVRAGPLGPRSLLRGIPAPRRSLAACPLSALRAGPLGPRSLLRGIPAPRRSLDGGECRVADRLVVAMAVAPVECHDDVRLDLVDHAVDLVGHHVDGRGDEHARLDRTGQAGIAVVEELDTSDTEDAGRVA